MYQNGNERSLFKIENAQGHQRRVTKRKKKKNPLAAAPRFSQPIFENKDKIILNNFSKIKG